MLRNEQLLKPTLSYTGAKSDRRGFGDVIYEQYASVKRGFFNHRAIAPEAPSIHSVAPRDLEPPCPLPRLSAAISNTPPEKEKKLSKTDTRGRPTLKDSMQRFVLPALLGPGGASWLVGGKGGCPDVMIPFKFCVCSALRGAVYGYDHAAAPSVS